MIVPDAVLPPATLFALHVTAAFVVPVTVAVNRALPLGATVAEAGETETVMFWLGGGLLELDPPPPPQAMENEAVASKNEILAQVTLLSLTDHLAEFSLKQVLDSKTVLVASH
ncbi:MAG TPA: hypothetical protein VG498_26415 [Terriglobales bacterium]|nr:hypothetical protein [Terriglobales bacterium]